MPNAGLRLLNDNGVTYFYDGTRGKIISTSKLNLRAGRKHPSVTNQYLRVEDGQPTQTVGDVMPRNAVLMGLQLNCESNATWTLEILKKGSPAIIASLSVVSGTQAINNSLNVDLSVGDVVLFKLSGANIPHPRAMAEIAWRL